MHGGVYHDFYHDAQHDPGVFGHDPSGYNIHHGSHYGVDGGGLGHGGHNQAQNFDANSYANCFGGHIHHHGGFWSQLMGHNQGHAHQGGIIAQLLGLNQGTGHHGLLATLLGVDSKHQYVHHTPPEVTRQGQFLWENLGRVFKHDLFNEFQLTPGVLFFVLISGMIGWLFVLNFTRHHEPQVNAILGADVAQVAAYENSCRLNQPNQKPIELPSDSLYSFYLQPNKFTLSRMVAKEGQGFSSQGGAGQGVAAGEGFAAQEAGASAVAPAATRSTAIFNQGGIVTQGRLISQQEPEPNGTSSVKTPDGRIETIVDR